MTIRHSKNVVIAKGTIECGLWAIQRYLMEKYGTAAAERETAPLKEYVYSGRASAYFLSYLLAAKPFMIGRELHKGGSDTEAIERVKGYLMRHAGYCVSDEDS